MSERKINLDDYVDELPLGVASYRNKIKIVLKDFAKELLELASENANLDYYEFVEPWMEEPINMTQDDYGNIHAINKQSILDTINQVE